MSKCLLTNKTMYKHQWKLTLVYGRTHAPKQARAQLGSSQHFKLPHPSRAHTLYNTYSPRTHTHKYTYNKCTHAEQSLLRWPSPLKMHDNAATVSKNGHQDQLLTGTPRTADRHQEGMGNLSHNSILGRAYQS